VNTKKRSQVNIRVIVATLITVNSGGKMKELFDVLAPYEIVFLAYALIYGVPLGFQNTFKRISILFSGKILVQSDMGKFLDGVFWFSLIVLFVLNVK
jgi:ABC-type antimicrobial peptide transport system permease subunit